MAVLLFTCLLRVGEAAPVGRGGSRARRLGFHTVKCDPHFVSMKLGSYGRAWLRWLHREGSTSAVPLAHFCRQGAAYLQMVVATTLNGCASAHTRWHACRRGGSAALRRLGLPVIWLAWWGRWMSQSAAAHYGDAADDFVGVDNVELPWPSVRGGLEWEWRVVPRRDMFPGELQALCVWEKDVGSEEVLGGWRDAKAQTESGANRSRGDEGGGGARRQPTREGGGLALRKEERAPTEAGTRGSRMSLWPSRPCKGNRGPSVLADVGRQRKSSTSMLSPPPPPVGRHLLYPSAPDRGTPDGCRRVGLRGGGGRPGLWVRLPERQLPAKSAMGRRARERLRCGEWDAWLRDLRACLPMAPPGLLERR